MLPPPPPSRQASYAYTLPRNTRNPSYAPSHTRRASGYESLHPERDSADGIDGEDEGEEDEATFEERLAAEEDLEGAGGGERGLEETLEKLGFGAYHWRLLALCGFGWMSDNSALNCIAVILPRVQVHFNLSHEVVGLLSACTMAGMMIGAVGWGTISDMLGRALPFNSTLFLTAVFGIGASFSPSFPILCVWMFFLGSAVGGSMPTDGTLFLENLPHSKQYLLTLLSVFFSLGAVLSSVVSLAFLPGASCHEFEGCDIAGKANDGWRTVLFVLGCFNLLCSFARWGLFRLHESPRYLVTNGREHEAVVVLRSIAKYNDHTMDIQDADVQLGDGQVKVMASTEMKDKKDSEMPSPDILADGERSPLPNGSQLNSDGSGSTTMYDSVGIGRPPPKRSHPLRTGSAFYHETPAHERMSNEFERSFASETARKSYENRRIEDEEVDRDGPSGANGDADGDDAADMARRTLLRAPSGQRLLRGGVKGRPRNRAGPFAWWFSWVQQLKKLFTKQWRRTVILMWVIWGSMSFGYTMFNVWLPAVLESRAQGEGDEAIRSALKEFVLYSLAGCPGSVVGAWMIQTRLGRRKSLAICTAATAISTFAFIKVSADWAVVVSSMVISAAATAMYAVLYGMTPETFGTAIRGTACGTSAALSRLTGVMAPITAGLLLNIAPALPLFVSAGVFCLTAACSLLLPFERVAEGGKGMTFAH